MTRVKRYEWEDGIIKAEGLGLLPAPSVNMALRLASAITWEPKGNKPSGLYWKNETALNAVGSSRATYFRVKGPLFEYGFFIEVAGNLIPQLPDLSQFEVVEPTEESHIETVESQVETKESQVETDESQSDTPYTVDTYTVNSFSVDSSTVTPSAGAVPAPGLKDIETNKDDHDDSPLIVLNEEVVPDSPIVEDNALASPMESEELGESQVETVEELPEDAYYMWNGRRILRAGYSEPFSAVATLAPVEPEVKCSECNKGKVFSDGLCWDCA